ncbi:MAG: sensor histidine kinase [Actinobacteria bacterium]|nr:sensor histidine kinase [Actinomycetota bacterium]
MRLRTRLTIAAGVIVTLASVSVGYVGLVTTERAQVRALDSTLAAGASQVSQAKQSPLTAALLVADQSQVALTVALRDINGELTTLRFSRANVEPKTSMAILRAATKQALTQKHRGSYRMRAVELPSEEFVILATSLTDVEQTRQRGIQFLGIALLASIILGSGVIFLLIRRDLKIVEGLIKAAESMSAGDTGVDIPIGSSTSEVDSLARALRTMVTSLNEAVVQERELATRMQTFLGDASHELRTPLTVVRGYFELLSSNPQFQGETEQRYLTRIGSEIQRMETLINDLLLLTETGDQPLRETEPVDLSTMVEQWVHDLKELSGKRPVTALIADGVSVIGSEQLLAQMCANLFRNLDVHTPDTAAVRVELASQQEDVRLQIDDAGPGLSEQFYESGIHAFQRFDPSRSRETGGSGLGMSITAAIVAQHHGSIALSRSDLGGLRTTIILPSKPLGG